MGRSTLLGSDSLLACCLALRAPPADLALHLGRLPPPDVPWSPPAAWLGAFARAWAEQPCGEALPQGLLGQQAVGPRCCLGGSWAPPETGTLPGGRVEATALGGLALAAALRYDGPLGVR